MKPDPALRETLRKVRELRACLGEFLDDAEQLALSYYPLGLVPRGTKAKLDRTLARYMQHGGRYPAASRADLRRIKRARRALGLPAWWERA